jgi:hypothetical protein
VRTAQQLYNTVVNHLRQQKGKSYRPADEKVKEYYCLYRAADGCKCAIGSLIPDKDYKPEMEEKNLAVLLASSLLPVDLVAEFRAHQDLLCKLQDVHDFTYIIDWERQFRRVATEFGLQYYLEGGEVV